MKNTVTKNSSATDWDRIDALTDEQIDTSEMPPLDDDFFARAILQVPGKGTIVLKIDADVLCWFQSQCDNPESRMREALRLYMESHQKAA